MINKRKIKRVPFEEPVVVNGVLRFKAIDISEGGIYLHTGRSFQVGTLVDVSFKLKYEQFNVTARIQFNQAGVGMGLKFTNLSERERIKIVEYVNEMSAKGIKAEVKKKILIIFDDITALRMHKGELIKSGYSVVEMKNVPGIYSAIEAQLPIDLVILALEMTTQDHFRVLSMFKTTENLKNIPILVISGNSSAEVANKVMASGATEFVSRMTASPRKLSEIVSRILTSK